MSQRGERNSANQKLPCGNECMVFFEKVVKNCNLQHNRMCLPKGKNAIITKSEHAHVPEPEGILKKIHFENLEDNLMSVCENLHSTY